MQWEPQPIWNAVSSTRPDLFLFLGDNIYGDWHGQEPFVPTAETLLADYQQLAEKPEFAAAREAIPFMATWDNHDYGLNNGGAEFEHKEMTRKVMLDFFGEPVDSPRRTRDGIYDAKIFGPEGRRVQVILLDNRWNRGPLIPDVRSEEERVALGISGSMGHTPNDDPEVTLLGDNQWKWLAKQFLRPAELRLICSGTQIVNDTKGMQEWGNFPHERQRLFNLIESTNAGGVVMLSGNVHYSEVCESGEGPYPMVDFTSSGMTHNSSVYAEYPNPYRVSGPFAEHNFGLVEIDWEALPGPRVGLKIIGLDGSPAFEYELALDRLQ
jgi:alkaline phosphatase D